MIILKTIFRINNLSFSIIFYHLFNNVSKNNNIICTVVFLKRLAKLKTIKLFEILLFKAFKDFCDVLLKKS